jgi:hypothetical protein
MIEIRIMISFMETMMGWIVERLLGYRKFYMLLGSTHHVKIHQALHL